MANDLLKGQLLKQAVAEYSSGNISKKALTSKTRKSRRLLGVHLTKFFNNNGWVFNEDAHEWIDSKKQYDSNKLLITKKSSISTYIAQIRAFNQFCIDRKYLMINFCKWIAKPPESETLKPHVDLSHEILLKAIDLGTTLGKGDRSRSIFAKNESRDALKFMLYTSRRSGEFVKLTGADINMHSNDPKYTVAIKGGSRLDFPIPQNLIPMFEKRQHKARVFEVSTVTTINHLRNGLRKLGIAEDVVQAVDNHTLRKAFAKERYRNDDHVGAIASAMADKEEVVRKYYLGRDLKRIKQTVNNTAEARSSIEKEEILHAIEQFARQQASDSRFQEHIVKKLPDRFVLEIPFK